MARYDENPAVVIWEVTRACGLACVHCRAAAVPKRNPLELSTEESFRLIDDVARMGRPLFVLTGGDPMEREDLPALVRHAVSRGLRTALSPSATDKVTRERLNELKTAGLHRVAVSLDSHVPEMHDAFRRVEGSYQRTMEIARDARAIGLPLQIGTTITRLNAATLEAMAKRVGELGAILWSVFFLVPTGRADPQIMIDADECENVLERLFEISRGARFAIKTTEAPHYRRIVAKRSGRPMPSEGINDAKGFVFISHVGDVCPSGFLPLAAGNVRQNPLAVLYRRSDLFRSLRDPDRLKGNCGRCEHRRLCGGSRARAYAMTGDILAADPLCRYVPEEAKEAVGS
ncbi:MAG: radical SAM protein [Elusimicrobia bacterium]|nr:radical SAM protein [Elusimicrobiota bacterium]